MIPGAGVPVNVAVNEPAVPTVNVSDVNGGGLEYPGAWSTVRAKDCVTGAPTLLVAVKEIGYTPPVFAAGVPESVAVPSPLSTKETPNGRVPVSVSDGEGLGRLAFVVTTVNTPADPTEKLVLEALENDAAVPTWSRNDDGCSVGRELRLLGGRADRAARHRRGAVTSPGATAGAASGTAPAPPEPAQPPPQPPPPAPPPPPVSVFETLTPFVPLPPAPGVFAR